MAFDGFITKSIVSELENSLVGGKINKVFEPNNNEIIIGIYANGKNFSLNICTESSNLRIHLTSYSKPNPMNAPNFCMLLRKYLISMKIKNIDNIDLERYVTIELEGFNELNDLVTRKLIIELMGKHSNVILVNSNGVIIDSLRHLDISSNSLRNILPAHPYMFPETTKNSFINISNFDEFYNILCSPNFTSAQDLAKAISNYFTGISKNFINYIICKLDLEN